MARPISRIVDDLIKNVMELRGAIGPIARLAEAFRGGDGPSPFKTAGKKPGRKRGRPKRAAAGVGATHGTPAAAKKARKKNPRNQMQGSYMAAVRRLSKADKAEVKKTRAEKGIEEAIKLAQSKEAK